MVGRRHIHVFISSNRALPVIVVYIMHTSGKEITVGDKYTIINT